jgi:hypothetical protein
MVEHVDPEVLALIALGEPASDADRAHLSTCAACAQEVESLAAVVRVGRSVTPADTLVAPPPAVWDRIRAELDLPDAGGDVGAAPRVVPAPPPVPTGPRTAGPGTAGPGTVGHPEGAAVAPVIPLRRRATGWIAAAAAGGLVVGGLGGAWLVGRGDTDPASPAAVVAQAALEPLPGQAATGEARVEEAADGERVLVVTLDGDGGDDGYHEVWLIDREVTRLVSLGVLTGAEGRFTVPPGLDLGEFPVVDVSDEPYDGDPAHSGDSIIRGVLDA